MPLSTSTFIAADQETLFKKAGQIVLEKAKQAIAERGRFTMALAGGKTPMEFYAMLATAYYQERLDWKKTFIFWIDERCVPPQDEQSNYKNAHDVLLSKIPIPQANIYRIPAETKPAHEAAKAYEHQLKLFFRYERPFPKFDLILLGVGTDGHIASLFPGTVAVKENERWVLAHHVEKLSAERITLTLPVINGARSVLFLVIGESKSGIIRDIFREDGERARYPAQMVTLHDGDLVWLLDRESSAKLPPEIRYKASHI